MRSLIKRIFAGHSDSMRDVTISLTAALAKLINRGQLESLIARTPDRRLLLEAAVAHLNRPEAEVLAQVAAILGLRYTGEQLGDYTPHLPSGFSLEELERLGLVPLSGPDSTRAILCCDPLQIRFSALAGVPAEIILAPWRVIALQIMVLRQQIEANELSARREQQHALAGKVLQAIIEQCKAHLVESCQLSLLGACPSYSFKTNDGRIGNGTIDSRIANSLSDLLSNPAQLPSQTESHCNAPGEYFIRWQNTRADNVIPLVRPQPAALPTQKNCDSKSLPHAESNESEQGLCDRHVMIVEDNSTFTKVLERFLQRLNVKTSAFATVEEALTALNSHSCNPDVIVADLHLPAKGGDDLIAAVRAMPHLEHVGILVLTSDDSCDAELKTIQLGADAFIGKNQDPRILCAHVERIISKQRAKRAA